MSKICSFESQTQESKYFLLFCSSEASKLLFEDLSISVFEFKVFGRSSSIGKGFCELRKVTQHSLEMLSAMLLSASTSILSPCLVIGSCSAPGNNADSAYETHRVTEIQETVPIKVRTPGTSIPKNFNTVDSRYKRLRCKRNCVTSKGFSGPV